MGAGKGGMLRVSSESAENLSAAELCGRLTKARAQPAPERPSRAAKPFICKHSCTDLSSAGHFVGSRYYPDQTYSSVCGGPVDGDNGGRVRETAFGPRRGEHRGLEKLSFCRSTGSRPINRPAAQVRGRRATDRRS